MKIRIMLLMLVGAAGVCASYALANDGDGHGQKHVQTTGSCQRGAVFGTASGPQTFTVTVTHAGGHSTFAPGQVVTVTVGTSGQPVRIAAEGCVSGSSVTARSAFVVGAKPAQTTTTGTTTTGSTTTTGTTTTTTTTATTTTSTNHVVKPGGNGEGHHGRHHHGG